MEVYKTVTTVLGVHTHFLIPDPPFKDAKLISVNEHIWGDLQPASNGSEKYIRYTTITAFWIEEQGLGSAKLRENMNRLLVSMQESTKKFEGLLKESGQKPPKSMRETADSIDARMLEIQKAFRAVLCALQDNGFLSGEVEDYVTFEEEEDRA